MYQVSVKYTTENHEGSMVLGTVENLENQVADLAIVKNFFQGDFGKELLGEETCKAWLKSCECYFSQKHCAVGLFVDEFNENSEINNRNVFFDFVEKTVAADTTELKTINVKSFYNVPKDFTGIAINGDGDKAWYLNGKKHRIDGPAVECTDGTKHWYLNGVSHRVDGPATEWSYGSKHWWLYGFLHRVDGPAIEHAGGSKSWYLYGELHRVDGPAYESADGYKEWWVNGELHRVDGPAREWSNGSKEWCLNGKYYSESDWKVAVEELKKETEKKPVEEAIKKDTVSTNKTELQTINIVWFSDIPKNFTGIAKCREGAKYWYLNGKQHREDGPAVEYADGRKEWWVNGQRHRVDGPAIQWPDGFKQWFLYGECHRADGPAVVHADGHKSWYLNGKRYFESHSNWKLHFAFATK